MGAFARADDLRFVRGLAPRGGRARGRGQKGSKAVNLREFGPPMPAQDKPKSEPEPVRGLGSLIAKGTKAIGVKPCEPCKLRAAKLDRLFPFSWGQK